MIPTPEAFATCAFCPRLCRHACPVATATGREAAVPSFIMGAAWRFLAGGGSAAEAAAAATLCVSCGACTDACRLDRPVADLLAELRATLAEPPPTPPPGPVEGPGDLVAVEEDERAWSAALARHLGRPVARLRTADQLGVALLDHPRAWSRHAARLREAVGSRTLVVASGGSLDAARAAGLSVRSLLDLVEPPEGRPVHTCRGPAPPGEPLPGTPACCGAREPLATRHPDDAAALARRFVRDLEDATALLRASPPGGALAGEALVGDAHCGRWLREHGAAITDPVDWLLAAAPDPEEER